MRGSGRKARSDQERIHRVRSTEEMSRRGCARDIKDLLRLTAEQKTRRLELNDKEVFPTSWANLKTLFFEEFSDRLIREKALQNI